MNAPPVLEIRYETAVPVLHLPDEIRFDGVRAWLEQVVPEQVDIIGGRTARLDLGKRAIDLRELRRVIHTLRERWDIEITGLYLSAEAVNAHAQRELRMTLFVHATADDSAANAEAVCDPAPDSAAAQAEQAMHADSDPSIEASEPRLEALTLPNDLVDDDIDEPESAAIAKPTHTADDARRTMSLRRTIRSGTAIRFDGDVIIYGDVNPGAQIVASGHITIIGALKGFAWAGASGDESCSILALTLRPTQLRIGRKIAIAPERGADTVIHPELASLRGDQIVIEPHKGRSRNP
jgi:septum site-determining protein MinC